MRLVALSFIGCGLLLPLLIDCGSLEMAFDKNKSKVGCGVG
jgi:hypothetical protein